MKNVFSLFSPAQNLTGRSSLPSVKGEFAESTFCTLKIIDKAEAGQVATYSRGGCEACCAFSQPAGCTAAPPHTALMSGKLPS